jgi:phage tail sheath gpL-like
MSDTLNQAIVPTINFTQIPPAGSLLVPGVYIEIGADYSDIGILPLPARILVIGQGHFSGTQAGNGTAGTIYQILQGPAQAAALFGAGSPAAEQVACVLASKPGIPVDAVGLSPAVGAVAAGGTLTFGGSPSVNGSQPFGVAGFRIVANLTTAMTPAAMATAFVAAAAASVAAGTMPVSFATNATPGQVAITAIFNGALGNAFDLRINPAASDVTVPGVTAAIVPIGTAVAGTGVPDITPVMSAIANTWYTGINCGFNDPTTLEILGNALVSRYNAMQTVDSHAYIAWTGTQGQIATASAGVNDQFLSSPGITNPQDPHWRWSAALCGVAEASSLNDPSQQMRGLVLPNIIAPASADQMFEPEQQALLAAGVTMWDVTPSNQVILTRVVTTYTASALGVPDAAWRDIMVPKTMTRIRYDWRNYLLLNFPNYKLSPDGSTASKYNSNVVTPRVIQGLWAARCKTYAKVGWIENEDATIAQSTFAIDPADKNRLNSRRKVQIIGNYMIDAEQLVFGV